MKKIFVLGASHHNTLSIVRSLGLESFPVNLILVGCTSSYVAKSKYVSNTLFFDTCEDLRDWLFNAIWEEKPILVCCSDDIAQMLDMNYSSLKEKYTFFNAGAEGRVTRYMDKQEQVSLAERIGISVPRSWNSANCDTTKVVFPCIIKPLQSYQGGKHIWICRDSKELNCTLGHIGSDISFQIQELIDKKGEIVLPGLSVNGKVSIPGYILKHREFVGGTTYSSVKRHNNVTEQLAQKAICMIKEIGYVGLFGFEFMYDKIGKYYFLELNLRNDATCYSFAIAGCNLPSQYIKSVCQLDIVAETEIDEIHSMVENKDFSNVIHRKVGLIQWIKQFRAAECKYLYAKGDIKPLISCYTEQFLRKLHIL